MNTPTAYPERASIGRSRGSHTNTSPGRATLLPYLYAFLVAVALTGLVKARTNSIAPAWDALSYLDVAKSGIIGNPNVTAPFAYRPGMPFLSRWASQACRVPLERGFQIVGGVCILAFLMGVFALARCFVPDYRLALAVMVVLGFTFAHVKFPLFFPTMIDVAAYPLIVFAFWALVTDRPILCLVISCVGLFFKEFLAIPWVLLVLQLGWRYRAGRKRRDFIRIAVALAAGLSVILLPRLVIHVPSSSQYIDPINDYANFWKRLFTPWFLEPRLFNVMYVVVSYWLPALVLFTRSRFDKLWADLRARNLLGITAAYLSLILILTMYGGTNIFVFISYCAPILIIVLALLLQYEVGMTEIVYAILVTFMYNKIMLNITIAPQPDYDGYTDFYGGWQSRVPLTSVMRFIEATVFIVLAQCVRGLVARLSREASTAR